MTGNEWWYFAHVFGLWMPWSRAWKCGFRTLRESDAYFRGYKDGRLRRARAY